MNEQTETSRILAGIDAQTKYCEETGSPQFFPRDGRCYRCGQNIFGGDHGYSPETAGKTLITGCPFCNASFCD